MKNTRACGCPTTNLRIVTVRLGADGRETVQVLGEPVSQHFSITPSIHRTETGIGYSGTWSLVHGPSGGTMPQLVEPEDPSDQLVYLRFLGEELEADGLDWTGPERPDDIAAVRDGYQRAEARWQEREAELAAAVAEGEAFNAVVAAAVADALRPLGWTEERA